MADTEPASKLRAWSLGTFHTAAFVLVVVVGLHQSGSLASRLAHLNTPVGVAAFLALWSVTWWITSTSLLKMETPIDEAGTADIVTSMIVAGGWNGVAVFATIFLAAAAYAFAPSPQTMTGPGFGLLPILFGAAIIGTLLAFTIGGIVGFFCGMADAALVHGGAALHRWTRAGR